MYFIRYLFIISLLFAESCFCKKTYQNYTLFRVIPSSQIHLDFLTNLKRVYDVNIWRSTDTVNNPVEFIINPAHKNELIKVAAVIGLQLNEIIEDVQSAFDSQIVSSYMRRKMDSFGWTGYYPLADIYAWIMDISALHSDEVKIIYIGKTYENRDIIAVRVILKGAQPKSKVIVEGGIHAREWIAPAFVTYMMNEILNAKKSSIPNVFNIAYHYEWYFIPVLNPDGYEYTHTTDRLWRKNRRKEDTTYGVDLNRNFGIAFGKGDKEMCDKGSEVYCGPKAFSERESWSMANFVRGHSENLQYYLAFHSYGQYMIIPYAYTTVHLDNYNQVFSMCHKASEKIFNVNQRKYSIGTAFDTVGYITPGVSGCWVKKAFRVPYVVTLELPDEGKYGFALPAKYIRSVCHETMVGMMSFVNQNTRASYQNMTPETEESDADNVLDPLELNEPLHDKGTVMDSATTVVLMLSFLSIKYDFIF